MKVALLGLALSFLSTAEPPDSAPPEAAAVSAPAYTLLEEVVLATSKAFADAMCSGVPYEPYFLEKQDRDGAATPFGYAWSELRHRVPPDSLVWREHRAHLHTALRCLMERGGIPRHQVTDGPLRVRWCGR